MGETTQVHSHHRRLPARPGPRPSLARGGKLRQLHRLHQFTAGHHHTQGTWCLNKNLSTSVTSGNAITVNATNVTIDCNYFKVGGLGAGLATQATGIYTYDRVNVVVRHCSVRGFARGAFLDGSYNTVEESAFDLNTSQGIAMQGDGSLVRGNQVSDTGGSPAIGGSAYGIYTEDAVDVIDNKVRGVNARGYTNGNATGIDTRYNDAGTIAQNRVAGLRPSGTGVRFGIYNYDSAGLSVRDNNVAQAIDVASGDIGIRCTATNPSIARDNIISGFATAGTPIEGCADSGNAIN